MKHKKIFGSILLIIGLVLVLGMAIWFGFPPSSYDRRAIIFVASMLGLILIGVGVMLIIQDYI